MRNGALSARDTFGEILRSRREGQGLTQQEVAELLGVSNATVVSWEQGRYSPRDHNLERLKELFDDLEATVTPVIQKAETPTSNIKRADVEAAQQLGQAIEELLVTAAGFATDDRMQNFLSLLLNKTRQLNGRIISIKAGLRD